MTKCEKGQIIDRALRQYNHKTTSGLRWWSLLSAWLRNDSSVRCLVYCNCCMATVAIISGDGFTVIIIIAIVAFLGSKAHDLGEKDGNNGHRQSG